MSKHTWFEKLLSFARHDDTPVVQGLVLSGGGSRASFQIGALRYLYAHKQIEPSIIVSTSGGSIIGSMLAQSLDADKQEQALLVLEKYWMAMESPNDMFAEQAWFTRLMTQRDELSDMLPQTENDAPTAVESSDEKGKDVVKSALAEDPSEDEHFSVAALWQTVTALPRIGRAGAELAASLRGASKAASAYRPGQIVYQLLYESGWDKNAVRDSGVKLRMAFVGLNTGELRYMRPDGIVVSGTDEPVSDKSFDLSLGIWASCAIPGVFRPVRLGDEVYVDGGVRDSIPVEMAVSTLGATKPYVVVASPSGIAQEHIMNRDMISSVVRAVTILMDESNHDEVSWARAAGATVIEPRIEVHGTMTVDHELLKINRDYGWMRAAEEVNNPAPGPRPWGEPRTAIEIANAPSEEVVGADRITKARLDLRQARLNAESGSDQVRSKAGKTGLDKEVRKARQVLESLMSQAPPWLLPDDAPSWTV